MLAKQRSETASRVAPQSPRMLTAARTALRIFLHRPDERAPFIMFSQHAAERAAIPRHSFAFQERKQQILLLAMVAAVCKQNKELREAAQRLQRNRFACLNPL